MAKSNRERRRTEKNRQKKLMDLPTARRMIPLVQKIVGDIVRDTRELSKFQFEQEGLDRNKIDLNWPERQRRYHVQGEVARLQNHIAEVHRELDALGAVLIAPNEGEIGFPTLINGRPAYFTWRLGERTVEHWQFDGEMDRQPIPAHWNDSQPAKLVGMR